ncbi:MAG TPA: hypothetical protein VI524_10055 [Anaerolineales bacterium]|nr:hypothetical protein [Anaerolineales bacterium]
MPIVDIEIVLKAGETLRAEWAAGLAEELGSIFASPPAGTWIKVRGLPSGQYAEIGGAPDGVYPIFVRVIKSKLPSLEEMQIEVGRITGSVAQICGRPSANVHIIYEPEAKGRVAFGGKIVL